MPRFAYAAIDATGASVEGVTKADTIGDARAGLLDLNLYPVKISEKRGALDFELTKEKVKKKELMHFTRQLAVFVKAGIPITEAMQIIGDETAGLLDLNLYPVKSAEKRGALDFELTKEKVQKNELMRFALGLVADDLHGLRDRDAMQIIGDETEDVALQRTITMMVDD